jgi:hypothetical protein
VSAQLLVGLVHVADDDRDVLKRVIVTAPVRRDRPSFRREILDQLDRLIAELHARDTHTQAEETLQLLVFLAVHFDVDDFLKAQNLGKKFHGSVYVRNRHADRFKGFHELRKCGVAQARNRAHEHKHGKS